MTLGWPIWALQTINYWRHQPLYRTRLKKQGLFPQDGAQSLTTIPHTLRLCTDFTTYCSPILFFSIYVFTILTIVIEKIPNFINKRIPYYHSHIIIFRLLIIWGLFSIFEFGKSKYLNLKKATLPNMHIKN
jgi:hypothetical protein